MGSNKEKRPLSSEEIDSIKESYAEKLTIFIESEWQISGGNFEMDDASGLWTDLGACDSLENFISLPWSNWRDHLSALDVDSYLGYAFSDWSDGQIQMEIVKYVFLTAYGIELQD